MTEGPYKLPEGWRWVRLGEVCETKMGGTPSTKVAEYWYPPEIVWVTPEDLEKSELNRVVSSRRMISRVGLEKSSAKLFPRGTVLLSTTATIGKVGIAERDVSANQQISGIVCGGDVNREFLAYYLLSLGEDGLKALGGTATATHINQANLRSLRIPLPPLEEQRRIVARIEELMERVREARRLRQQAREDAEQLWQSVLADTFPRPGSDLPNGWHWVRLEEIFEVQQGASMSPKRRAGRNPKPFLRTKNVLWGTVDLSLIDEMDFTDKEIEKLRLQPGDLLVCEGGDVGRTAIWEGQLPLVLYQNHIHRLRAKDAEVEPRFFMYWMQAAYQVFLAYQGAESRTAIPNLSGRRLKNFNAPLPPLSEQRRIVAHLEAVQEKVRALKAAQEETDEELKRLEQAILDKAFRGEL